MEADSSRRIVLTSCSSNQSRDICSANLKSIYQSQHTVLVPPNMNHSTRSMESSALLSLPLELRQEIWQYLLSPNGWSISATTDVGHPCTIVRQCTKDREMNEAWGRDPYMVQSAHDFTDISCACNTTERFYTLAKQNACVAILRTCRGVYEEALPYLYKDRMFGFNRLDEYVTLHDRITDMWWLAHRFLTSLSSFAREHIYHMRLPMILGQYEVYGCHEAFYSLAPLVPSLKSVNLEMCLNAVSVRYGADDGSTGTTIHAAALDGHNNRKHFEYWLGPILAFGDANIRPVCVDKLDLEPELFRMIKTHVETAVWMQLLPLKKKRAERRMNRIRERLASFSYEDCEGLIHTNSV